MCPKLVKPHGLENMQLETPLAVYPSWLWRLDKGVKVLTPLDIFFTISGGLKPS